MTNYIKEKVFEGDTKILYKSEKEYLLIQFFKDNFVLDNGKIIEISGKGVLNNKISSFIMSKMDITNIENHFIEKLNMREQLIQWVDIIPIEVLITNIACGNYISNFDMNEGYVFDHPMISFQSKNMKKSTYYLNESQLECIYFLEKNEIDEIKKISLRINDFLIGLFSAIGIRFVEARLKFGRVFDGERFFIILASEITPDNCRLWNMEDNVKLDFEFINNNSEHRIMPYNDIAKRFEL